MCWKYNLVWEKCGLLKGTYWEIELKKYIEVQLGEALNINIDVSDFIFLTI